MREYATNSINKNKEVDNMLKQMLIMFWEEGSNSITRHELNGYFYGFYDVLFIMVSNNCITQCAYNYLIKKMEKIKGILMYQKFSDVGYLNRLEKVGRL